MKGHAAVDPDSEIVTATTVTPGNAADASAAEDRAAKRLIGESVPADEPLAQARRRAGW